MPNKITITMHIFAYLFLVIANAIEYVTYFKDGLKAYEISVICNLVVYSICTLIFGIIVNQIATKLMAITEQSETVNRPLMAEEEEPN